MNKLLILVLLISFSGAAHSKEDLVSGLDLSMSCSEVMDWVDGKDNVNAQETQRCYAYILGFAESTYMHNSRDNTICIDSGVLVLQLVEIVKNYLDEHTEQLHLNKSGFVWAALEDKFPCGE